MERVKTDDNNMRVEGYMLDTQRLPPPMPKQDLERDNRTMGNRHSPDWLVRLRKRK